VESDVEPLPDFDDETLFESDALLEGERDADLLLLNEMEALVDLEDERELDKLLEALVDRDAEFEEDKLPEADVDKEALLEKLPL
jgi:hypothetical protein